MRDFRKLIVWQKSHELVLAIYRITKKFPQGELYGLTSQIRRCSTSIAANIAEGCGRDGGADFARFLQIALGSASELEYHILLAHDLQFLKNTDYESITNHATEVKRMLTMFIKKIRKTDR